MKIAVPRIATKFSNSRNSEETIQQNYAFKYADKSHGPFNDSIKFCFALRIVMDVGKLLIT